MKTLTRLTFALALLGALAGCGKSSRVTAPGATSQDPAPSTGSDPRTREEARPIAQQSAQAATSYIQQVRSLVGVAVSPNAKPAAVQPHKGPADASDSLSWTYAIQGYDAAGAPIDYVTQGALLASLGMDWRMVYRSTSDSLSSEFDWRSHSRVDGFLPAATRFVANATDTMSSAWRQQTATYRLVGLYDGWWKVTNLAWEKGGVPAYPVSGSITMHWRYVYEYTSSGQRTAGDLRADGTITFNGTRYASVVVAGFAFTVDLETGAVS